jgi:hypothetical protein
VRPLAPRRRPFGSLNLPLFGRLFHGRGSSSQQWGVDVFLREGCTPAGELRAATCACLTLRHLGHSEAAASGAAVAALAELPVFAPALEQKLRDSGWAPGDASLQRFLTGPWRMQTHAETDGK